METLNGNSSCCEEKAWICHRLTGAVKKEKDDEQKAEQWETCNNMVIAWIHTCVSYQIRRSILYTTTAEEAWKQLESTFNVANGSRN